MLFKLPLYLFSCEVYNASGSGGLKSYCLPSFALKYYIKHPVTKDCMFLAADIIQSLIDDFCCYNMP
jgi:hypothetical protein